MVKHDDFVEMFTFHAVGTWNAMRLISYCSSSRKWQGWLQEISDLVMYVNFLPTLVTGLFINFDVFKTRQVVIFIGLEI